MPPITAWSDDEDNAKSKVDALKEACAETDAIRKRKGKPRASVSAKDFEDEGFTAAVYDRFNAKKPATDAK